LPVAVGEELSRRESEVLELSRAVYEERLAKGVAREQARKDLPLSTYTEAYWKVDLHNLLHFLSLRMDSHAQKEIRAYADVIGYQIVQKWVPITWQAFVDYRLSGLVLTKLDKEIVARIGQGSLQEARHIAEAAGWLELTQEGGLKSNRERIECESKIRELGLTVPW
jgi:thymidylate synthase (FAD)